MKSEVIVLKIEPELKEAYVAKLNSQFKEISDNLRDYIYKYTFLDKRGNVVVVTKKKGAKDALGRKGKKDS